MSIFRVSLREGKKRSLKSNAIQAEEGAFNDMDVLQTNTGGFKEEITYKEHTHTHR